MHWWEKVAQDLNVVVGLSHKTETWRQHSKKPPDLRPACCRARLVVVLAVALGASATREGLRDCLGFGISEGVV
jgi:hypothetical protein